MSEEEWTIEDLADENFLQTSARMTVGKLNAAERAALLRALIAQAGGVETKAVRRSHGTIVPAGAVPLPGDKIIPALLLPMEGSE